MFEKIFLFVLSLLGPRFKLVLGVLVLAVVAVLSIAGFRGEKTRRPPIEIFPDMDRQFKLRPETTAGFYAWANNMSSRPQVAGTVAQRHGFKDNTTWAQNAVNTGKDNGAFIEVNPLPITLELLKGGEQRYGIYCQPCHGAQADGNGVTKKLGMTTVANLQDQRIIRMTDGEIFQTVSYGKNTMLGYAAQIPVEDRWAIIAYLRALQLSRLGVEADVPAPVLQSLKK
ncbi:MAG: cytochrome c [Verrucomicrobiales bacterium]|nr:cytochrome c [Verrucomicrobiales bacterium]